MCIWPGMDIVARCGRHVYNRMKGVAQVNWCTIFACCIRMSVIICKCPSRAGGWLYSGRGGKVYFPSVSHHLGTCMCLECRFWQMLGAKETAQILKENSEPNWMPPSAPTWVIDLYGGIKWSEKRDAICVREIQDIVRDFLSLAKTGIATDNVPASILCLLRPLQKHLYHEPM